MPHDRNAPTAPADATVSAEEKSLLRFLTAGSVDDGKSTLIGRLLWDAQLVFDDQRAGLTADSAKYRGAGEHIDYALLLDGLEAEREQGITIDVAYRYFATPRRKFIVADTPGHEQYTRNMATGASNADLAVILVDATKGILVQTKRHSHIVSMLGIRHVVLAVNKMDRLDYAQEPFEAIAEDYRAFTRDLGFEQVLCLPVSALAGDNVIEPSANMPWYHGPTLLAHLETVDTATAAADTSFRMPVQWVNRPDQTFRGFSGTIASGVVRPGDEVVALPSGRTTKVARIVTMDGDLERAAAGVAVTLTLADEIDVSRGDVLASVDGLTPIADQFAAHLLWMHEDALLPGRPYLMKLATATVPATVTAIKHRLNVDTLEPLASKALALNEIGYCNLALDRAIPFTAYTDNPTLGGFILVDRYTNDTVGAGMLDFALRRATNIHWQPLEVNKELRAGLKAQRPHVLWFTGLSGSGKSTVASQLEKTLHAMGKHTFVLDGDNVRHGLNKDLGFTDADRVENIRRVAEVAKLLTEAGLIVLVSFISPFRSERRMARELFEPGEFVEVFVDAPLEICESRDPKGLYKKARAGQLPNFSGITSPYEAPENAEIRIDTADQTPEQSVEQIVAALRPLGLL